MRGPKRGPSPLTRPRRRSIASSRSSSSRALSEVAQLGRAVEEARLVLVADRVGLAQGRDGDQLDAVLGREQLERVLDLRPRVLKVRAEPDEASGHGRDCPSSRATRSYRVTRRAPHRADRGRRPLLLLGRPGGRARASRKAGHLWPAHLRRPAGLPAHARRARPRPRQRGRARAAPGGRPADRALARALAPAELDRAAAAAGPPAPRTCPLCDARRADRHRPARRERLLRTVHRSALAAGVVAVAHRRQRVDRAGPGRSRDDDRLRRRPLARGVRRSAEHDPAEHADFRREPGRVPRHVDRFGRRRARQRQGDRRHLPSGEAPALGREPDLGADRRRRDRGPRRGAAPGEGCDQPQPRRLRPAADRGARDHERLCRRPARRRFGREQP